MAEVMGRERASSDVLGLGKPYRWTVLVVTAIFFAVPILASARYAFEGAGGSYTIQPFSALFGDSNFWTGLLLSLKIGAGASVVSILLLVPTTIYVSLRLPRLRKLLEGLSLLPLVIPTIVIVLGVLTFASSLPSFFVGTPLIIGLDVVLALPYSFRALDASVQALDLKTLVEAGHSLGASWREVLLWVLVPNLRTGIIGSTVLVFAFALGEFVVPSFLGVNTLSVYTVQLGEVQASEAVAVSLIGLLVGFVALGVITVVGSLRRRRAASLLVESTTPDELELL